MRLFVVVLIVQQCLWGCPSQLQFVAWLVPVQFEKAVDPKLYENVVDFPKEKPVRIHVIGGIWSPDWLMQTAIVYTRAFLRRCIEPAEGEGWELGVAVRPETYGFLPDLKKAAKGLAGGRLGLFNAEDLAAAREIRRQVDADLAQGYKVIVIGVSYGAFLSALALGDGPEGVGLLVLGSPVDVSSLGIPYRDFCVGGDPVCAARGPIAESFGFGAETPGLKELFSQHFPHAYLVKAQGNVMQAFAELCQEMGYPVLNKSSRT